MKRLFENAPNLISVLNKQVRSFDSNKRKEKPPVQNAHQQPRKHKATMDNIHHNPRKNKAMIDIRHLTNTKEYCAISSDIRRSLNENSAITPQAKCLWNTLYDESKFDKAFSIKIPLGSLARMMGRSKGSIKRYTAQLKDAGYLDIYREGNGYSRHYNQYSITAPDDIICDILAKPDRKQGPLPKTSIDTVSVLNEMYGDVYEAQPDDIEEKPPKVRHYTPDARNEIKYDTPGIKSDPSFNTNINIYNNNSIASSVNDSSTSPSLDCSVIFLNKKEELDQKIKVMTKNRAHYASLAEQWEQKEHAACSNGAPYKVIYEHHLEREKNESCVRSIDHHISCAKDELAGLQDEKDRKAFDEAHPFHMADREGGRKTDSKTINYIMTKIGDLGVAGAKAISITNEIIYASRFGQLVNFRGSRDEMPIKRSINVALKILREGRWDTPFGMSEALAA